MCDSFKLTLNNYIFKRNTLDEIRKGHFKMFWKLATSNSGTEDPEFMQLLHLVSGSIDFPWY